MNQWAAVWIATVVVAFIGLVALWGWWRHQFELEGKQIAGVVLRAQARRAARVKLRDEEEQKLAE